MNRESHSDAEVVFSIQLTEEAARHFVVAYGVAHLGSNIRAVADQIRAQLRMAQPGWGEKVWATHVSNPHTTLAYLRVSEINRYGWQDQWGRLVTWDDLLDPRPWRG